MINLLIAAGSVLALALAVLFLTYLAENWPMIWHSYKAVITIKPVRFTWTKTSISVAWDKH
ncbi:hypothetical protein [Siphonobacter sp.]|uniref:hypothetical protein n=1 Tax=Siphonobacter sp. TaxID=1869184 RepID=UPI003B3A50DA